MTAAKKLLDVLLGKEVKQHAWVRFWMKVFFDCKWVKNK